MCLAISFNFPHRNRFRWEHPGAGVSQSAAWTLNLVELVMAGYAKTDATGTVVLVTGGSGLVGKAIHKAWDELKVISSWNSTSQAAGVSMFQS